MQDRKEFVYQSWLSLLLTVTANSLFLFSGLWSEERGASLFAMMFSILGLVLSMATNSYYFKGSLTREDLTKIVLNVGLGLMSIFLANNYTSFIPFLALSNRNFNILIAVSEEDFFRGFVTPYLANHYGKALGCIIAGGLFGIYHLVRYSGDMTSLMIVSLTGVAFSFIALQTHDITGLKIAHVLNNMFAG